MNGSKMHIEGLIRVNLTGIFIGEEEAAAVVFCANVPVIWVRRVLHKIFVTGSLYFVLLLKANIGWLISATNPTVPTVKAHRTRKDDIFVLHANHNL